MKPQVNFIRLSEMLQKRIILTGGQDGAGIANIFLLTKNIPTGRFLLSLKEFRNTAKYGLMENILVIIKVDMVLSILILPHYIKQGEDNVLAVAVNNRQKDEFKIPPMAAGRF